MTVAELIKILTERHNGEDEVLIAQDAEGNQYMKLDEAQSGFFLPYKEFHSSARFDDIEEYPEDGPPAGKIVNLCVLWPI